MLARRQYTAELRSAITRRHISAQQQVFTARSLRSNEKVTCLLATVTILVILLCLAACPWRHRGAGA